VLRSRGIRTLDAVVITHPDRDHYGGLLDLSERVRVRRLLVPTLVSRETAFTRLVARLRDAGTQVLVVGQGSELAGAGFGMRFLWPDGVTRSMYEAGLMPTNAVSLVAMVEHAGFRMLLTSDMEDVASLGEVRADLLKSPHHGSRKGNLDTLFRAVQPGYVVVMGRYPTPAGLEQRPDPAKCVNTRRDGGCMVRFSRAGPALVPYGGR
jgi:competence protein ComEC